MNFNGVIALYKPAGITSARVISRAKKDFGFKKLGHGGTLDNFATGVLVALVGRGTKFSSRIMAMDKSYRATIQFGSETDTLDPSGEVIHRSDHLPTLNGIEDLIPRFIGTIMQMPPRYSALKVGGKRSSDLVRKGEEVELAPRQVRIDDMQIISFDPSKGRLEIQVDCGKGTYIRSLARDMALELRTFGHLIQLERTKVGPYTLENALSIESNEPLDGPMWTQLLISSFEDVKTMTMDHTMVEQLRHGKVPTQSLPANGTEGQLLLLHEGSLAQGFACALRRSQDNWVIEMGLSG